MNPIPCRELVLSRLIDAPRDLVFKAWTDPEQLKQWFAPQPYTTPRAELDVRPNGRFVVTLRGPDGSETGLAGLYLDVVENERIVYTQAMPAECGAFAVPAIIVDLIFADQDGQTHYTANVLHWTPADRLTHERLGFHEGWGQCADQLVAWVESSSSVTRRPTLATP